MVTQIALASLNTLGLPLWRPRLTRRYPGVGVLLEADRELEIVNLQEVFTYRHLVVMCRSLPSFPHVSYRRGLVGPSGGLVTFARTPLRRVGFRRLPVPRRTVPWSAHLRARLKGVLISYVPAHELTVINVHPAPNRDGDWSPGNRHHEYHRVSLHALAELIAAAPRPLLVTGDFNVDRDSALFADFIAATGLVDAFGGECPPTFHEEFLDGQPAHTIDFILTDPSLTAGQARVFLEHPGPDGYLSDHLGLRVTLNGRET